jgi:hypothetical protein
MGAFRIKFTLANGPAFASSWFHATARGYGVDCLSAERLFGLRRRRWVGGSGNGRDWRNAAVHPGAEERRALTRRRQTASGNPPLLVPAVGGHVAAVETPAKIHVLSGLAP